MSLDRQFATASARLVARDPTVEQGRILRALGLKTYGRFFAYSTGDDLVVKLPAARVGVLIASGTGRPVEVHKGSPLREWVCVRPADEDTCAAYLTEARDFVAGRQKR